MLTFSQMFAGLSIGLATSYVLAWVKTHYFEKQPNWPIYVMCGLVGWFAVDLAKILGF